MYQNSNLSNFVGKVHKSVSANKSYQKQNHHNIQSFPPYHAPMVHFHLQDYESLANKKDYVLWLFIIIVSFLFVVSAGYW